MQDVVVGLLCDYIIKKIEHMSKQNNQIVEGSTFIIILVIISGLFLFGGQTFPSSRLVQTEISCKVPTFMNPRDW
jgi:hypothetical protein